MTALVCAGTGRVSPNSRFSIHNAAVNTRIPTRALTDVVLTDLWYPAFDGSIKRNKHSALALGVARIIRRLSSGMWGGVVMMKGNSTARLFFPKFFQNKRIACAPCDLDYLNAQDAVRQAISHDKNHYRSFRVFIAITLKAKAKLLTDGGLRLGAESTFIKLKLFQTDTLIYSFELGGVSFQSRLPDVCNSSPQTLL
ncbi:hypothetical protein EVAR_8270_1 [Eumeta japonica]|uniref:Uncharacterized protein n=1 Tax=Eumeta variegata TaxID=151549 RepID=A0A4C1TFR9_EUMVA|nr:hypothetical protein EVAR_8270_1 [Eumeta japonica]